MATQGLSVETCLESVVLGRRQRIARAAADLELGEAS
jgi:hypothetical protein